MTASFFRNVKTYRELLEKTERNSGIVAEYRIFEEMVLPPKAFFTICNDFSKETAFLKPYINKAIIKNGIWNCLSINYHNNCILIVMDGYHYPRFLALKPKKD